MITRNLQQFMMKQADDKPHYLSHSLRNALIGGGIGAAQFGSLGAVMGMQKGNTGLGAGIGGLAGGLLGAGGGLLIASGTRATAERRKAEKAEREKLEELERLEELEIIKNWFKNKGYS